MKCPHCHKPITLSIHPVRDAKAAKPAQRAPSALSFAQERQLQVERDAAAFRAANPHYVPPKPPIEKTP